MNNLLEVHDLKTHFFTDEGVVRAVDGVSFSVHPGEMLGIVGESGCGKSVTAFSISRLLPEPVGRIVNGKILFNGEDLALLSEDKLRQFRGSRIAMIFQEPMTSLNPVLTIGYQLEEILAIHGYSSKSEREKRAVEVLGLVGISDSEQRLSNYPHQMSGGMRQRAMIAMGLACSPDLLIADEPTTALDVTIQAQILELLSDLQKKLNMGVILITHNLGVVAEMARDIIVMYAGKIVEKASAKELFLYPSHPYTVGLLESIPKLRVQKNQRSQLATIPGNVPHSFDYPAGCRFSPRCPFALERCRTEEPPFFAAADGAHQIACWLYENARFFPKKDMAQAYTSAIPIPSIKKDRRESADLLKIENLSKYFSIRSKTGKELIVKAVEDISLSVRTGEVLGLVGESGCGKTTTGKLIAGLVPPSRGNIFYNGQDLVHISRNERRDLCRKIQMIFQDPYSSLNPRMTVEDIVGEGLDIHHLYDSQKDRKDKIRQALLDSGLSPDYMSRYPHEFSGGQRQRIGIARALVMGPELVICDEPVSALDVSIQAQIINLLQALQKNRNLTYLFIAHDLSVIRHISDRVAVMYLGRIMEIAETDALFDNWKHPYTEALLSAIPNFSREEEKQPSRIILEGEIPSPINPPSGCPFRTRCFRKKGAICDVRFPPLVDLGGGHRISCWWFGE